MSFKEQNIKILSEREKVRDKIAVWFGSADNYYHPVREVILNSIDEIINNFENGIVDVILHDDNRTITIKDTGRGMPLHLKTDGIENWKLLFLTLFAGGKYDNNETGDTTGGTNGVGNTCVCYSSDYFEVISKTGGNEYKIVFENGGNIKLPLTKIGPTTEHGTSITFKLSDEVYTSTRFDEKEIENIVKHFSIASNKVRLIFKYKDYEKEYHYESIKEYFEEVSTNLTCKPIEMPLKSYNYEEETNKMEFILATSSEPLQETYLNMNFLPQGGTINEGIMKGVRKILIAYAKENKKVDKALASISLKDVQESLIFVCNFFSTKVSYSNQTKFATEKKLYEKIAMEYVCEAIEIMKIEQPKEFERMIEHILTIQNFNNKNDKAKKQIKKKLSEKISINNRIDGLVDCKKHGPGSELFIAEGQSALGSIILARDAETQAAIAIRGKILNCLKAPLDTIFKNKIVLDLIKAIGCGIEADKKNKDLETFNKSNLRYERIVLAADADADGENIVCLLLTMFYRLTPTLIKDGHIYIAHTPLYEIKYGKDEMAYIFNEAEKEEVLERFKNTKYVISRCKGLGEIEAEVMNETAMNPETRHITKVTVEEVEKMIKAFEIWMDNDVSQRKEIIETRLDKYVGGID